MAFDLALSEHGDLLISGHGDLLGKSGIDLIEQRMLIRLRVQRGAWVYDSDKTFGSNLQHLVGSSSADASTAAIAFVREALRPMKEISVDSVDVVMGDDHSVTVNVNYRTIDLETQVLSDPRSLTITLAQAVSGTGA